MNRFIHSWIRSLILFYAYKWGPNRGKKASFVSKAKYSSNSIPIQFLNGQKISFKKYSKEDILLVKRYMEKCLTSLIIKLSQTWHGLNLCMLSQSLWIQMCISCIVSGECYFLRVIDYFWILKSFCIICCTDPWALVW